MDYVIGLGSNLGSRRASLDAALQLLGMLSELRAISALYESEPVGPPQPRYLNAAVRIASELAAPELLRRLLAIEQQLGRRRSPALRWGARTLDLDILWAPAPWASDQLTIPHPRLLQRWFALAPLLDVAPELQAQYGASLAQLGGRRGPCSQRIGLDARGEARVTPSGLSAAASAADVEDALADALGALGRQLWPSPVRAAPEVEVVQAVCAGRGDGLRAFAGAVLQRARAGFAFARVTVCELASDRVDGRLLGARSPGPVVLPELRTISCVQSAGEARVVLELGAARPA